MKCIRIEHPDQFDYLVNKATSESNEVFVLFFGREDPKTNLSWCPDCVIADPKVRKAITTVPDSMLLEVPVDRKSDTRSLSNVYRTRGDTNVERIPTLVRWTEAGPSKSRLIEDECTEEAVLRYVKETTSCNSTTGL
ncbi:hypothetical protein LPJ64_005701 [Coemansia asiatica]|uniref:Thioredoxin domain-containing protein n=1 Tax=Coemansia asiatica TaxID=1052880 RepID=A0A9W7XDX1_9FUNG|nr:hypothetical protein LPJ64_005701 [Coemansia asiatica]KAJ2883145.1 hypothetical protein FB639_002235 [Coemansia asiatica]